MNTVNLKALSTLKLSLGTEEALLIENPIDLLYLLGKQISLGTLLILPHAAHLFVDGRYFAAFSKLTEIQTHPAEKGGFIQFCKQAHFKTLYFDSEYTSYDRYASLKEKIEAVLTPKPHPLKKLRMIKSKAEVAALHQSSALLISVYEAFLKTPKLGLSEKQIAASFKKLAFEMGADSLSFEPIMASGENGAYPHHRPSDRILKNGEALLIDIGICKNQMQSDMTRMVFYGTVPPRLLKMHDEVLEAHSAALAQCKPGTPIGMLDQIVRDVFKKYGDESLYTHSLGHGLGLETHEPPRISLSGMDKELLLEPGMVITIEPGLYQEGLGGIRHEDLILITDSGYENFYPEYI